MKLLNKSKAEAEEKASANALRFIAIEEPSHEEENRIADGFVQLTRVAWQHIDTLEDERPRHICRPTNDFGIHQVAKPNGTSTDRRNDSHIVQHPHDVEFHTLGIKPQGNHQPKRTTVAGKTLVARKRPALTRHIAYGQKHLRRMRQVVPRLIEKTMPQASTNQDAQETIHKHRFELLFAQLLLAKQTVHQQVNTQQTQTPKQRIPPNGKRTKAKGNNVGIPGDEQPLAAPTKRNSKQRILKN
jgi:hypothetical protein